MADLLYRDQVTNEHSGKVYFVSTIYRDYDNAAEIRVFPVIDREVDWKKTVEAKTFSQNGESLEVFLERVKRKHERKVSHYSSLEKPEITD